MLALKGNKLTYFGHSTFGLTSTSGQFALVDPWVTTNPRCPENMKKLERLEAIFLTHGHSDHMGDMLALAKQYKPRIVATFETYLWLESKKTGAQCLPANKGGSQKVGDFEITMTNAFHSNSIEDGGQKIWRRGGRLYREDAWRLHHLPRGRHLRVRRYEINRRDV